ncbi:hypothetical protein M2138_002103 [Dysgonomonadaceae bacterium PH5-43]|nr:hypothetical protein [Dysgonomonadaceae bacterium PH5-43]
MEYKELELLWKQYDKKLDNLEELNKKLLKEMLLRKPQKKLNRLKVGRIYSVIALPIILLIALHPHFNINNITWIFILGCILTLSVIFYLSLEGVKSYHILKTIDLSSDTIIQSLVKVTKLQKIANNYKKSVFILYPIITIGIILIGRSAFVFNIKTIIFLTVFFIITYVLNIRGGCKYKNQIDEFEKDILELKEYSEKE